MEKIKNEAGQIRLNKFISNSGYCSRREADKFIMMGLVKVNGKLITQMGYKINPNDKIKVRTFDLNGRGGKIIEL